MIIKKEWTHFSIRRCRNRDACKCKCKGWFLFGILPIYMTVSDWY